MNKLSTTKLANHLGIDSKELFNKLSSLNLMIKEDKEWKLTPDGENAGGEYKEFTKDGQVTKYIVWPQDLKLDIQTQTPSKLLTSTEVGKSFNISARKLNPILSELGWVTKGLKGWKITQSGKSIGGVEKEDFKTGVPYVVWSEKILSNKSLLKTINEMSGESSNEEPSEVEKSNNFREKFEANFRSTDGHYVRSKAEMLIDNWLYMAEIVHAYERKLPVEEDVYCDFYLPTGKVYIEFWGYENDPKYLKRKEIKKSIYKKYNFNLIELNDEDVLNLDDVLPKLLLKYDIQAY
jgi:hypothetical protein